MILASCHCGAVRIEIDLLPETLTHYARMIAPQATARLRIRTFDGADTRTYLD